MAAFQLSKSRRLLIIIAISFSFFGAEIAVGFYTGSLALVADAFHYLNDLVGFIVAFVAFKISERTDSPKELSFGWSRANLLGAFFNGVFLLALGVSIFLQSLERFVTIREVENPQLVLIIGGVGLCLNIISAMFLHEHDDDVHMVVEGSAADGIGLQPSARITAHDQHRHEASPINNADGHGRDLGMMGVLIHILGDAVNNVGVIIAAAVIWKTTYAGRFYADPAVSMAISIMIFASSWPLVAKTGKILMESVPMGVKVQDVQHDLEKVPGIVSVHELHIWRLNQQKSIASAHIVVSDKLLTNFMDLAKTVTECFHAYGIHSATLQPELATSVADQDTGELEQSTSGQELRRRIVQNPVCRIGCGTVLCEPLTCCG